MLNTSFCRCKTLLKLSQSVLSTDLSHKIDLRCYTDKVIYSSESPHETECKPINSSKREKTFENKKYSEDKSYRRNDERRATPYKAEDNHRNPVERSKFDGAKDPAPIKLFDSNYVFLDNNEKVRIKPKSPFEEDNLKPEKLYRRNYKIKNNSAYSRELLYAQSSEENEGIQSDSDQVDHISQDRSTLKLRKKYSFDSNLTFKEDSDNVSPLNLDIANIDPSSTESTTECSVDTTSIDSSLITSNLRPRYKTIDTAEGQVTLNLADDEFDVKDFVKEFNEQIEGPLDENTEDISYFGPDFSPTFNFAAYADKSTLIQQYVKLGVKLYKVEKRMDHMRALLSVDLEKELPVYIQFLHDCGIPANCIGDAITENPMILKEDLDDMRTRIRYLSAHNFTQGSIARIISKNPSWLVWATKYIDERLGHFQNEFKLQGSEMRFLATKAPKLITYPMRHVNENTFAVREQMGFGTAETKLLLLYKPRLWMNSRRKIMDSFDYLHNTMNLPHLTIASQADVMTTRKSRIKSRHEFLVELKKAQYDPKKPGYIAPKTMVVGSDADFCTNVAKTAVDTYNLFLKTR